MQTQARAHHEESRHPTAWEYVRIAVILTTITAVEVAIYYMEALKPVLVPLLLVLSATKFAMVVMWYMHLKFDNRLFSSLFVFPLILAAAVILALISLFALSLSS